MTPETLSWAGTLWHHLFDLTLPVAEKVLRPVLVYAFLVTGLRVFGKRELAQLNPFDLVVLLSLANTVQNAIIGDDTSVTGGVIGALSLLSINYLVVRFLFGHRRLDQIVEGSPTVLVEGGRMDRRAMARELFTEADLSTVLHRQGFATLDEVERCTLEPGGTVSVTGKNPRESQLRHSELLGRVDELTRQIAALNQKLGGEPAPPRG